MQKCTPCRQNYARKICCSCAAFLWRPPFVVSLTNLLQPTPLWAPAAWGAFFISCHLHLGPVDLIILQVGHVFFFNLGNIWPSEWHPNPTEILLAELLIEVLWCCLCIMKITKTDFRVAIARYYITQLLRDRVGITLDPDHEAQECQLLLDYPLFFQDLSVFSTIEYSNPSQSYTMFMFHWMFHLNVTPKWFEQAAYEMAFMPHGFTPRQFLKVVDAASGRIEEAVCGTYLCRQGGMLQGMFQGILSDIFEKYIWDFPALRQVNRRNGFTISWKVKPCWLTRRTDPKCRCQW